MSDEDSGGGRGSGSFQFQLAAPSEVDREAVEHGAEGLSCSISTAGEYSRAVRIFYRWAVRVGVAPESPVPTSERIHPAYGSDERWQDGLQAFERAQIAAQIAPGTIRRRVQHVRRFADAINLDPWHVQAEDYGAWLARIRSDAVAASSRNSLRAFYRWAVAAGE